MYSNLGNASNHPTSSSTTPINPNLFSIHQQNHRPIMIPLAPFCSSSGSGDEFPLRDERFPQWSNQETRDLIEIRAQCEGDLSTTKRNNNLWATVSYRMREKGGYRRTPEQCKYKWENLVNRYKGEEKPGLDNGPRCPFFDELHAFFTSRANHMQQFQDEYEAGLTKGRKKLKTIVKDQSSNKLSEDEDYIPETDFETASKETVAPKGNVRKEKRQRNTNTDNNNVVVAVLQEILGDFSHQQQKIDMQWSELMGKRAQQREVFEQEWRQTMERLERERIMNEQAWFEREEQWRMKEESRAEKRDALLTALLDKLIHEDNL